MAIFHVQNINPEENPHGSDEPEVAHDAEEDSEHEVSFERLNLESSCSFEEYVMCDRNVQCSPMPNNEDIIASIASTERDEENDIDDHGDELPNITYQAASQALSTIRAYLL